MKPTLIRQWIACFRALRLLVHLCYGMLLVTPYPMFSSAMRQLILRKWSAALLGIFNVRVTFRSTTTRNTGGLIVANHISWLDVFVLNSVLPTRFIAKSEVRNWPFIGWLCVRANTIFIHREKRHDTARVNQLAVTALQRGEQIALFPEGTSTDGTKVRHFHASLLQPAIDAGVAIRPIAIRYHDQHGHHSTDAAYIDEMSFLASLWNLLCSPALRVQLTDLPLLPSTNASRRTLATQARHSIAAALNIKLPDDTSSATRSNTGEPRFQSMYHMLLPTRIMHEPSLQPCPHHASSQHRFTV